MYGREFAGQPGQLSGVLSQGGREYGAAERIGKMKAMDGYSRTDERASEAEVRVDKRDGQAARNHFDDSEKVYPALGEVVQVVIDYLQRKRRELSAPKSLPMADIG
jgi:hypothetical protein